MTLNKAHILYYCTKNAIHCTSKRDNCQKASPVSIGHLFYCNVVCLGRYMCFERTKILSKLVLFGCLSYPTTLCNFSKHFFTAGKPKVGIYLCVWTVSTHRNSLSFLLRTVCTTSRLFPQTGKTQCSKFTRTPVSVCQKSNLNSYLILSLPSSKTLPLGF